MMDEESESESSSSVKRQELSTSSSRVFKFNNRGGYKLWAVAVILLLAFWSMFTGSVTLKWTSLNNPLSVSDSPLNHHHLDILEVEEREKLVRRLWDVYTHSTTIRLPRFWQEAFEAAYDHLISEASAVRDDAVAEIAKMSLLSLDVEVDSPPAHSQSTRETSKAKKHTETRKLYGNIRSKAKDGFIK